MEDVTRQLGGEARPDLWTGKVYANLAAFRQRPGGLRRRRLGPEKTPG